MSIGRADFSTFFRHFTIRFVAFVAAFAVALPGVPLTGFSGGTAEAGQKRSGGAKSHRGGGVRKMRVKRSGGHRVKSSRATFRSSTRSVKTSRKAGTRSYTVRRSVLDGRGHGSIRKGKMPNIKRYGKNDHYGKGGMKKNAKKHTGKHRGGKTGERRSGVRLGKTTNVSTTGVSGLREVAGSRSTVKKTRIGAGKYHGKGHKGGRHVARSYTASGALVVVIEGGHSHGLQEVAGNGGGMTDCAYGSYCTIDLGGPKIITYNDVADISQGNIADENLSDEEYDEKYGGK